MYGVSEFGWEDTFRKCPPLLEITKNSIYQNLFPEYADVLLAINMTSWKNYMPLFINSLWVRREQFYVIAAISSGIGEHTYSLF